VVAIVANQAIVKKISVRCQLDARAGHL
jgi:hypothetical protein